MFRLGPKYTISAVQVNRSRVSGPTRRNNWLTAAKSGPPVSDFGELSKVELYPTNRKF
jgi:hypothetical protein